jgi:hypothetical protein
MLTCVDDINYVIIHRQSHIASMTCTLSIVDVQGGCHISYRMQASVKELQEIEVSHREIKATEVRIACFFKCSNKTRPAY